MDNKETANTTEDSNSSDPEEEAGWLRTALPQVLANSAKNLLFLTIGMVQAYPTVLLPAVQNVDGPLRLDDYQASWIGSISFIAEPAGSLMSGTVMQPLGRKWAMVLVNVPFLLAWLLVYFADSPAMFYWAFSIMGLSIGLMESPILVYAGESSQPKLRGILSSYAQMCWMAGFLVTFLLGSFLDWKNTALISLSVPVLGIITISMIPETPIWLLSRNRETEAQKSLQWLRGWVSPAAVEKELSEMKAHREATMTSDEAAQDGGGKLSLRRLYATSAMLFERKTLRPMLLIWVYFLIQSWTGQIGVRPYVIQVCEELDMPVNPHWITVTMGAMNVSGCLLCLLLVSKTGNRFIALTSLGFGGICCILLGVYAYGEADGGVDLPGRSWAPMVLLVAMVLATSFGTIPIPWNLISEVFPFRTRDLASGICAAVCCVFDFSSTKTFLDLKSFVGLQGIFWLNGIVGLFGMALMYFCLYETEGRTLEEIEEHYSGNSNHSKNGKKTWLNHKNVYTPSANNTKSTLKSVDKFRYSANNT